MTAFASPLHFHADPSAGLLRRNVEGQMVTVAEFYLPGVSLHTVSGTEEPQRGLSLQCTKSPGVLGLVSLEHWATPLGFVSLEHWATPVGLICLKYWATLCICVWCCWCEQHTGDLEVSPPQAAGQPSILHRVRTEILEYLCTQAPLNPEALTGLDISSPTHSFFQATLLPGNIGKE